METATTVRFINAVGLFRNLCLVADLSSSWKTIDVDAKRHRDPSVQGISDNGTSERSSALYKWSEITSEFSGMELTYINEDRLFALAGIASEFGAFFKKLHEDAKTPEDEHDRYVSGLWFPSRLIMWRQAKYYQGNYFRVKGLPTSSWASMGVRKNSGILGGLPITYAHSIKFISVEKLLQFGEVHVVPVRKDSDWVPDFKSACPMQSTMDYEKETRFTMLNVRGRLHRVCVGGMVDTGAEREAFRALSGIEDDGKVPWNSVKISEDS
ncbi:hypothetical protein N0V90_005302 [Kalmusia sp. IMI 367209]|nr:hypothetical protein N0V90_005302 [Kalmusia sp. IMI 367209]